MKNTIDFLYHHIHGSLYFHCESFNFILAYSAAIDVGSSFSCDECCAAADDGVLDYDRPCDRNYNRLNLK